MKTIWLLLLIAFLCWLDLPERWSAELAGSKPATVSGYSNKGTWKRPWKVEVETGDGRAFTNGDSWTFKYLDVGDRTEWTRAKRVHVGGFFLRWSVYILGLPLVLACIAYDLFKLFRRKHELNNNGA